MTDDIAREAAVEFLADYSDPEIEKRLYFDVWADRRGLDVAVKGRVWHEVLRLTHRLAAQKREVIRRRRDASAAQGLGREPAAPGVTQGQRTALSRGRQPAENRPKEVAEHR